MSCPCPPSLDQLKKTLSSSRAERIVLPGTPATPRASPYETIGALVTVTARGSSLFAIDREAILAAVVAEFQLSPEPLWQSLLLVRLHAHARPHPSALGRPGCEDLDQSVLLAFLEAARSPVCRVYVARNLRLLTQAKLFTERRREHRAPALFPFDEETHPGDPFESAAARLRTRSAPGSPPGGRRGLVRIIEAEGGASCARCSLTTYGDDASVRAFVNGAYAACSERVRARASKRLRRARHQVFLKLSARYGRRALVHAKAA